ncbi:MAG: hypothetical protein OT477_16025 [Chloroflexi bacterium]|nr:hypothetical protein [Chloroflexota bacterium]
MGKTTSNPIAEWFELSRAQFLTVPRLVMEAMPVEWQEKMADLLREMDETFDWRPSNGRYWVRLKDDEGRFTEAPLGDYRRGSCEHLRRAGGNAPQGGSRSGDAPQVAYMQVCVPASWTDNDVQGFANEQRPAGTAEGWRVRRENECLPGTRERASCQYRDGFVHIMLDA